MTKSRAYQGNKKKRAGSTGNRSTVPQPRNHAAEEGMHVSNESMNREHFVRNSVVVTGINNGGISIHGPTIHSREDVDEDYEHELELVGKVASVKAEELVVRSYVNNTLWRKKKFISVCREMDFGGRLCNRILKDLNVGITDQKEFWFRNRSKVQKWLCIKRNNTTGCIKREFMSTYII